MADQSFANEFFQSLVSSETGSRFSFAEYFSGAFDRSYDLCSTLPYLLCSKSVSVSSPFSYEISHLDAYCMILTTKGTGTLYYENTVYELNTDTFAFIDCHKNHKLVCLHNIWAYTICFISTPVTAYYYQKLCKNDSCCFKLGSYTSLPDIWEHLLKFDIDDEVHAILRCNTLVALFTELYMLRSQEKSDSFHVPSYLASMKKSFDTEYDMSFSLDELARKYKISKYRLCREFSQYYQDTPLQYLNNTRISHAKELLLHTDERICTIGQMVGIDNTNHFIRLFKEKTGVTPLRYRRETPIVQSYDD